MQCRYCREEIQDRASKCKECGELLGFRRRLRSLSGLCRGFVAVLVPVASLGLAFVEHQAKERAVEKKEVAQMGKDTAQEAFVTLAEQRSYDEVLSVAARDLEPLSRAVLPDEQPRRTAMEIRRLRADENKAREEGDTRKAESIRRQAEELETAILKPRGVPEKDAPKAAGFLLLQAGKPEDAVQQFEKALEKNPLDAEASKGLIYSRGLIRAKGR